MIDWLIASVSLYNESWLVWSLEVYPPLPPKCTTMSQLEWFLIYLFYDWFFLTSSVHLYPVYLYLCFLFVWMFEAGPNISQTDLKLYGLGWLSFWSSWLHLLSSKSYRCVLSSLVQIVLGIEPFIHARQLLYHLFHFSIKKFFCMCRCLSCVYLVYCVCMWGGQKRISSSRTGVLACEPPCYFWK